MGVEQLVLCQRKAWVGADDAINALHSWVSLNALYIGIEAANIPGGEYIAPGLYCHDDGRGILALEALREQVIGSTRRDAFRQDGGVRRGEAHAQERRTERQQYHQYGYQNTHGIAHDNMRETIPETVMFSRGLSLSNHFPASIMPASPESGN